MSWRCHGQNYGELVSNLQKHGILTSPEAAAAMSKIDRKLFVPDDGSPYDDSPQVIDVFISGYGATISAAHMHGYCLSLLADHLKPGMRVLDVGSGSGYLTAVFGLMVGETGQAVGLEHIPELVEWSTEAIKKTPAQYLMDKGFLSLHGINLVGVIFICSLISFPAKCGLVADGKLGYADDGPYNAIHVGAAAAVPEPLVEQLKPGGRMVIPVGTQSQDLDIVDKLLDCTVRKTVEMGVRYVPLI